MKKVEHKLAVGYLCLAIFSFLLIVAAFLVTGNNITEEPNSKMSVFEDLDVTLPDAYTIVIKGSLPMDIPRDGAVTFYSIHQSITVKIDHQIVYEFSARNTLLEKTPGSIWNYVPISNYETGKELEITLVSPYKQTGNVVPTVYIGSEKDMILSQFKKATLEIVLCSMILVLGIVILLYWIFLRIKTHAIDYKLCYLGTVATVFGIWSFNEVDMGAYLIENRAASVYLAYMTIMLLVIPFTLFIKSLFTNPEHPVWIVICVASGINYIVCTVLQLLHILDFRQSLYITHSMIITFALISIVMIILEVKEGNLTKVMKINIIMLLINFVGVLLDLVSYYFKVGDSSVWGRVCFLAYIAVLGYMATRENSELMNKGREAEIYHRLAFLDALTGMSNRTALTHDFNNCTKEELEDTSIIMFDLNNLKECNDTLGHQMGDRYIILASEIIRKVFLNFGTCYRIGGDEFCVMLHQISNAAEMQMLAELHKLTADISNVIQGCHADIAYGLARYQDGDLNAYDIMKRADAEMYLNKKEEKGKNTVDKQ